MIDEGYIKFDIDWRRGPPPDAQTVAELNRWRKPLYEAGLIGEYADLGIGFGNISMRSGAAGQFVISGTQTGHLGDLGLEHYALVTDYDIAVNRVSCSGQVKASSESMTHAAIYELNPAITGVVHVHSATMWNRLINSLPTTNPDVAYGTPAMAQEFLRLYHDTDFAEKGVAIMAGHDEGILSFGTDLTEAAGRILDLRGQD